MTGVHEMIGVLMSEEEPSPWTLPWTAVRDPTKPDVNLFSVGGIPLQPPEYFPPLIMAANARPETEGCEDWDHEPYEETVIRFEFEGWRIESYKDAPKDECDWVTHYCPVMKWRSHLDQWAVSGDGVCPGCCQEIPEELMGVWKLKNFDHMPSQQEARSMNNVMIYTKSFDLDKHEEGW